MDLRELFSNVDDITDPSLMDYIYMYIEEIKMEDDEFMQILISKQNEMDITWKQPWYQLSNCLTRPFHQINSDEKDTFKTHSISQEEIDQIHQNWRQFRKLFGVPNKPICLARWKNKEKSRSPQTPEESVRRFIISYLAQGLQRNLYQIYKHFLTYYGYPNKGAYDKYEENIMEICMYHAPNKAVPHLSTVLSRDPRGIYKRLWQFYNGKPDKKKFKWTLPLASRFLNLLLEHTGETSVENLKQKKIEKHVWLKLEEDIQHQHVYLQRFWYDILHAQLFVKSDVKINKLRWKVLKILKQHPYQVWSDICWKDVVKHFPDAFSHCFLNTICRKLVQTYPKGYLKSPLEEVIDYGIKKSKSFNSRRLKTLVFNKEKELEVIQYPNKMKFNF